MIKKNYFDFFGDLNENVQQAKVYLKNLALKKKKEAAGETDQPVGLSADEVRAAETNPNFTKIKEMCRENPGYTYLFTKIFFEEYQADPERFEDLKTLYSEIKSLGNLIRELPMPLDRYATIKPTEEDQRPISERISDDIEKIRLERSYVKFYNELLPNQKKWVDSAILQQKEKLRQIGISFGQMGKDDSGRVDPKEQISLQRTFYSKLADFTKLDDLIDFAINYIKSLDNAKFGKFISKIDKVNTTFGPNNGAKVIYNKDGYLVLEIFTFIANKELNGHTSHCIVRSDGHWNNYLKDFNKQYYVYDFNIDPLDPKSVIGMTIEPNGDISAAHDKLDDSVRSSFKSIIANMGIPFKVFTPMTEEEIQIKKKRIEASKKIIDPNLTLELAEEYLKNGADPNAKSGTPLINAVKADNKDLVNLLLKKGARPNITGPNSAQTAVTYSSNLDMVKILVGAGATLNSSVFVKLSKNYESVKYLLESGLDPNFERGYPFRTASMAGDLKIMDILLKFADNVPDEKMSIKEKQLLILNERRRMALKWACDSGKDESVLFILDKLKELDDTDLTKDPEKFILSLLDYVDSSEGINSDQKLSMSNKIKEWLSINFNVKNESKRFRLFKDFIY